MCQSVGYGGENPGNVLGVVEVSLMVMHGGEDSGDILGVVEVSLMVMLLWGQSVGYGV